MICKKELLVFVVLAIAAIFVEGKRPRARGKLPRLKELKNGEFACRPRRCPSGPKAEPPFCQCTSGCTPRACPHGERFDKRTCDCVPGCFLETCPPNQVLDSDLCMCSSNEEIVVNDDDDEECAAPSSGCPVSYQWDQDLCRCVDVSIDTPRPYKVDNVICEMPGDGCEPGYVLNAFQCKCQWIENGLNNADEFCSDPPLTCQNNQKWDKDLCACRPVEVAAVCKPPKKGCRNDRRWDSNRCKCVKQESIINEEILEPQPCVFPEGGCRSGQYFDREFCQCRTVSYY